MELTQEDGRDVVWGCHPDWVTVEEQITDTSRWSIHHSGVFHHIPSNKYYSMWWSTGATEYQDEQAFDGYDPEPVEVEQVEKVVKVWQKVEK